MREFSSGKARKRQAGLVETAEYYELAGARVRGGLEGGGRFAEFGGYGGVVGSRWVEGKGGEIGGVRGERLRRG